MTLHLKPVDPNRNRARFYRMGLGQDLFGVWTRLRSWGRIGTNGRDRIDSFDSRGAAQMARENLHQAKTRRGYVPLPGQGGYQPEGALR